MPQPSLKELKDQTPLNDVLKEQTAQYDDCLPCRLMGSAAFTGLGIYTWHSGMKQLRERDYEIVKSGTRFGIQARKGAILVTSAVMVGLGVYRLRN
ncbi:hypothetical protein CLAFUW4_04686 [Fulvia fulva]|uniref:Distal membrane-arm assembly complex protein 1-like domain-containing protein n=1 Tax=Passalora fulva TaxID=5499 RepID=A0A9Q8LGY8_PASFU|nr:uncharacterized protein CLAFUR5_04647 [Fulvia fulva]KAK4627355.1 hypothetical protein CLAFUR4_04672 [Fulvia fulva]KAK4628015.1 hypothetical protein CLAFUR0_04676 [Fulvia fulva]UJO16448.1 hypothetical protein CLAFUR5_04647 [Fulvia fulva]WPV13643.1 hypothetical protein CLAFUW4_04686 [Fulvia fulva]WPV28358.1 hypothetical protein CLAFUW7_04680 [Fulvia fulva]